MAKALSAAREAVSNNAPRITTITIPKDKIREVIGSGGKVIREICEVTGAKIDIEDDGTIKVAAVDADASRAAIDWIRGIVAEPELGVVYNGKVVKTVDFGAFVNFLGARDGLVHISELAPHRVGKVTDVVKVGDQVKVKVLGFDDRGKVKLSMKQVDQATGEDISAQARGRAPRPARGSQGRDVSRHRARRRRHHAADVESRAVTAGLIAASSRRRFPPPRIIGHRGAASSAPENTLAGLRRAHALGARWVEFDVQATRDDCPILLHDARLERTTDGRGIAADRAAADIARARCRRVVRQRVTAASACRASTTRWRCSMRSDLGAVIEMKAAPGAGPRTMRAALAALRAAAWRADCTSCRASTRPRSPSRGRQAPDIPRALIVKTVPADWRGAYRAARRAARCMPTDRALDARHVAAIAARLPLRAYTVNAPERARTLFAWGAAAVFTDCPDVLLSAVGHQTEGPASAGLGGVTRSEAAQRAGHFRPRSAAARRGRQGHLRVERRKLGRLGRLRRRRHVLGRQRRQLSTTTAA